MFNYKSKISKVKSKKRELVKILDEFGDSEDNDSKYSQKKYQKISEAIKKCDKKISELQDSRIKKELKKYNKKLKRDRTPYRFIVIKDTIIKETNYDKKKFTHMKTTLTNHKFDYKLVEFGKVEAIVLDLSGHIAKNSNAGIEITANDRQEIARKLYIAQKSSSFLQYSSVIILAGILAGFTIGLVIIWLIEMLTQGVL